MSITYALLSPDLDDNNSIAALKAKGVKSNSCIYSNKDLGTLLDKITASDTLVVLSIDRFGSVCRMVQVFEYLRTHGVAFKSIQEPYLEFRDGKELKRAVVQYLYQLGTDEVSLINNIENSCKYPNYTAYLSKQVRKLCLRSVQRTFCEQGILRRRVN